MRVEIDPQWEYANLSNHLVSCQWVHGDVRRDTGLLTLLVLGKKLSYFDSNFTKKLDQVKAWHLKIHKTETKMSLFRWNFHHWNTHGINPKLRATILQDIHACTWSIYSLIQDDRCQVVVVAFLGALDCFTVLTWLDCQWDMRHGIRLAVLLAVWLADPNIEWETPTCNALWVHMTSGNFYHFLKATDNPLARQMPAVITFQRDCERVYWGSQDNCGISGHLYFLVAVAI